jgi:hypothetical protein
MTNTQIDLVKRIANLKIWGEPDPDNGDQPFYPSDGHEDSHQVLMDLIRESRAIINDAPDVPMNSTPRVLILVEGGITSYESDPNVDVEIFDWDDFNDDPEHYAKLPKSFADLAALTDTPIQTD